MTVLFSSKPALSSTSRDARRGHRRGSAVWGIAALAGLLVAGSTAPVFAQGTTATVEKKTLTASDGWPIHITYFESSEGKESGVVILLHQRGGNRLVWDNRFAGRLQEEGYAVVTVDLRKHGESKSPVGIDPGVSAGSKRGGDANELSRMDYFQMAAADLEAVKDFLYKEHQAGKLNMRKTAIIAAEMSVPVAMNFAWKDWFKKPYDDAPTFASRTPRGQDIRAMVLISPEDVVPGLSTGKPLLDLRNPAFGISFLFCYGNKDRADRGGSRKMYQKVAGIPQNKDRTYLKSYTSKYRGTELLGKKLRMEEHMLAFLDKHLKQLNGPADVWRDRESKLVQ